MFTQLFSTVGLFLHIFNVYFILTVYVNFCNIMIEWFFVTKQYNVRCHIYQRPFNCTSCSTLATSNSQVFYALKILRDHGLCGTAVQAVFCSVIGMVFICFTCMVGICWSARLQKLCGFLCHSSRLGFYSHDSPSFDDLSLSRQQHVQQCIILFRTWTHTQICTSTITPLCWQHLLQQPRTNNVTAACPFAVAAPRIWNSLPVSVTAYINYCTFKTKFNTHLFYT